MIQFKHNCLSVADADRSAAFYQTYFAYSLAKRQESDAGVRIVLERDDHRLQLFSGGPVADLDWRHHLAYIVSNFDAIAEAVPHLRAPYQLSDDGPRIMFAKDPDGYPIEVIEAQ